MLRLQKKDILEKKLIYWSSKTGEARKVGLTARAERVLVRRGRILGYVANAFQISDRYATLF